MRATLIGLILGLLTACGNNERVPDLGSPDLIIRHVNVVDVDSGRVLADRLVAMADGKFTAVIADPGTFEPAAGTHMIDGTGTYAIPGLWDMHVHVCWSDTNASLLLPALLAHGITGVRDMGGDLRLVNAFKKRANDDPSLGPDLIGCGPLLDGDPPVFPDFSVPLDGASKVEYVIDSLVANGADFIKVYSLLGRNEFDRIAAHCRSINIPFEGHLSELVEPEHAIDQGQRSIEHLNRLDELWSTSPALLDSLATRMVRSGAWSCPTLVVYDRKARAHDPALRDSSLDALVPGLQQEWISWLADRTGRYATPRAHDSLRLAFERQMALVKRLHDLGVPILAGSDLGGQAFIYPGTGLLEELDLLVRAGLTPNEALRAATILPARYFGKADERGSIAVGKQADLVLLNADPLGSIANVRTIEKVIHRGVLIGTH